MRYSRKTAYLAVVKQASHSNYYQDLAATPPSKVKAKTA